MTAKQRGTATAKDMSQEGANIRIAVVDDEKMLLHVFSSLMRQYHYKADFYSSPVKALQEILVDPTRFQLVISDIRMPEMDGLTFAKKIRDVIPNFPILFMTGEVNDEVRQEAMKLGNVAFLEKPFPLDQTLRETIPTFLGLNKK
ncbi:MAG: Sensor histidine kinase RcsC [Candidatus Omnitrophica bacterium]|nr:Sensor histidine kinase RcsC [Candidatus Omnitrophota bacterium]